jgi:uncharacterized membrane protein HdeD (DUF308 family)
MNSRSGSRETKSEKTLELNMYSDVGKLSRNWGALVVRGGLAILFGLIAFLKPGMTLALLIALFAAFAFVDGIFALIAATRRQHGQPWWAMLLLGLAGIAAAGVALFMPGLTALTLVFVIAGWAIASGVLEIAAAIRLREQIEGEWILGLVGVLSLVFGIWMVVRPGAGALALIYTIGAYAILIGGMLVGLGLKLRRAHRLATPSDVIGQAA